MSRYSLHVKRWSSCTACPLHETRKNVVLARGTLPCDILFVGEGPGLSEDIIGRPFVGPAGKLLDRIISRSIPLDPEADALGAPDPWQYSWAFTNLVACIPLGDNGAKTAEPTDESIEACSGRLKELVEIADPKLIVCVGRLAKDWLEPGYKYSINLHRRIPIIEIVHPAAILRTNITNQGLMIQKCVVTITNAVEDLGEEEP